MELPRFLFSAFRRITGPFRHRAELHEILAAVTAKGEDHIPGSTGPPAITEMDRNRTLQGVSGLGDLRIRHTF